MWESQIMNVSAKTRDCSTSSNLKMELSVVMLTGVTTSLYVEHTDTIGELKRKLYKAKGYIPNQQCLMFQGKRLEDESVTVARCGINKGSSLHLILRALSPFPIKVVTQASNKIFQLDMLASEKVADIKRKIQERGGFPQERQSLSMAGKNLKNEDTLYDCGIETPQTLDLVIRPHDSREIFIKGQTGYSFLLDVTLSESVESLKAKIKEKTGIHPDHQCLSFPFTGKQLAEGHKLQQYDLQNGAHLNLTVHNPPYLHIFVRTRDSKLLSVEVLNSNSIETVKRKIEESEGIPRRLQRLLLRGKALGDSYCLSDFDIEDNKKTFDLVVDPLDSIEIFIKLENRPTFPFTVARSDSVDSLKAKLAARVAVPPDQQILTILFCGKQLQDGHSLSLYDVTDGVTLELKQRLRSQGEATTPESSSSTVYRQKRILFCVKQPNGKYLSLEASLSDTVRSVKTQIQAKTSIPPDQQHLTISAFLGKMLQDDLTLFDYNIQNDSLLFLTLIVRLMSQ